MYMTILPKMLIAIVYPRCVISTGPMYPTNMHARHNTRIVSVDPRSAIDRQTARKTLADRLVDITRDEAARINESTCSRKLNV